MRRLGTDWLGSSGTVETQIVRVGDGPSLMSALSCGSADGRATARYVAQLMIPNRQASATHEISARNFELGVGDRYGRLGRL